MSAARKPGAAVASVARAATSPAGVLTHADRRSSRFTGRATAVARALLLRRRSPAMPANPQRILVAHHLLLGDTLMLTPLLKKLRALHPAADIAMTVPRPIAPLYATRPYGVRALPFDPRHSASALYGEAPFDVAFVPGDNRYAWLAAAMRARWIVAFDGDRPAAKSWPVDDLVAYPDRPGAWGDLVAQLIDGPAPPPYRSSEWKAPPRDDFALPAQRYAVLHVGASSPLKQWSPARWRDLAAWLAARGIAPVWSAGANERAIVDAIDPEHRHPSFAGQLDLAQLWHLLVGAELLVAPDTGVAHLGRIVSVPTVTLFGPGSALLCGAGDFWRDVPYRAVTIEPFPCRDQRILFKREIDWVRRCGRSVAECPQHLCMPAIAIDAVQDAVVSLLESRNPARGLFGDSPR
jgi:ADP-heptose:LPS heptosyltransferase